MKNDELNPRIKIRAPLRCDGIGRLDCAEDTESGARLAVRWLPLDANGDAAVRACAKLPEHPTLPRVRQTGVAGDKAFLAMEFPDGKLLSTLIGEAVGGDLLLETGAQLADALATIHTQHVVHGEMSAESVLIAKGKAYLWDMPLVIANRLTDRRGEERLMHQLVRTAAFLSPERARGAAPSAEGDVYGLAAVMCLAGGAPMPPPSTTLSLVHAIVAGEWAPVVPALFHEPFRSLLTRMLSREPSKRPTAREVADLLGKPAAAIPTIPEMPAIALPYLPGGGGSASGALRAPPPGFSFPRAAAKSPFSAAPGSLEPMLPTKAVADAAKALPTKPLQITVPTRVEPTVKVNVPVQVLVAMSQPIAVDAELKAVVEALRMPVAAEVVPTLPAVAPLPAPTTTLEFGTALPKKTATPTPAQAFTTAQLQAALERKTPSPAQSPLISAVQAAIEAPQAAITAPNPPPIPRRDSREMPPPPMAAEGPVATPPVVVAAAGATLAAEVFEGPMRPPEAVVAVKRAAVEVQENICVSAETYAAGAGALDDDESLDTLQRSRPNYLIAAALLAVLTIGLAFGARALSAGVKAARPAQPLVTAPVKAAQPSRAEPVKAVLVIEDELSPLPQPKKRSSQRRSAAKLEGKYDSHGEAAAADDFSFLNTGYEAPKEELKRPQF